MMDLKESHLSLRDALEKAKDGETILLEDKTYFEKIELNKKNITLIGQPNTKITFDAHAGMIIPESLGGDGVKKFTTTTSATFMLFYKFRYFITVESEINWTFALRGFDGQ